MRFTVNHSQLTPALSVLARIVPSRSVRPILSSILIQARDGHLTLAATDLETAVVTTVPALVNEEGRAAIPSRYLSDLVKRIPAGNLTWASDSTASGSVTVNGQSANVEIVFTPTPTYSKVNVTGTIDPYNATLYINGQIVSTAGGAFNVSLAPGTYQIQVKSQGYQTFTETISVPSNRSYFSLGLITLQKNSSPPPAIPSWIYLVIALLIVGVIAGAAASVRGKRSRGKPRPPPPPPSH